MANFIDREEAYWKIYNYMLTFVGWDAADNPTILDKFIAELRDEICDRIREIPAVNDNDLNRWIWGDLANERRKMEQGAAHRTNADKIRAMTDEELVKHLCRCPYEGVDDTPCDGCCEECVAEWLKEERDDAP